MFRLTKCNRFIYKSKMHLWNIFHMIKLPKLIENQSVFIIQK